MPNLGRTLQSIKARRQRSPVVRALFVVVLRIWKLARRLPFSQRVCVTLPVDGHRLRVRLFSYDDLLVASPGYESLLREWLPPPGGVAVDAGAFIGSHTMQYAQAVGANGRVVAIEPLPENYRLLKINSRLNGYPQISAIRCALGDTEGEVALYYEREGSTASIKQSGVSSQQRTIVPMRGLDDILQELDIRSIDLLKIDVEGAELSVLQGAEQTLAASPNAVIVVEVHGRPHPLVKCPVKAWLAERDYVTPEARDGERRFYYATRRTSSQSRYRSRYDRLGRR